VARLSVVVPVYDVERVLPACLDSIAAQTFTDYEVVVVDDGSPDRSARIVERRARRDRRIRLVRQPNAGLGAARNAGVRVATGELLAFADSDDTLPPHAFARMVATLDRTGSDLVSGSVERVDGEARRVLPLVARNHAAERLGLTLADQPLMLADVFAWNKVYRRDFWDGAGLVFPERVAYEDQPTITRALLAARFDVLADVVYHWHVRGGSNSRRRHRLDDLVDRLATKRDTLAAVETHGDQALTRVLVEEVLPADMWEYFRAGVENTDEYWATLVEGVRHLWPGDSFAAAAVPERQREMARRVAADDRAGLAAYLAALDAGIAGS
jgi:glycosyltransferase involved in cell wall biosynthesis